MSDVFQGPGWWMASDGKWYAPDVHPDPAHRDRFAEVTPEFSVAPTWNAPAAQPSFSGRTGLDENLDSPDDVVDATERSETVDVESLARAAEAAHARAVAEKTIAEPAIETDGSALTDLIPERPPDLGADPIVDHPSMPVVETETEPHIGIVAGPEPEYEAPTRPVPETNGSISESERHSRARLEVDVSPGLETDDGRLRLSEPTRPPSTDLVHLPRPPSEADERSMPYDRAVAAALFITGVAMIVGTFVDWTTGPVGGASGWERGDGLATIVAGVLGSAAAGPIFVGFHHIVPKTVAIVSGLVGIVVTALVGLDVLSDSAAAATGLGTGFWIVLAAAIGMTGAGIADQSQVIY
ncbi:MAG: hypothetical protein ACR2P0_11150 [Acidimicrobiales bacterium]